MLHWYRIEKFHFQLDRNVNNYCRFKMNTSLTYTSYKFQYLPYPLHMCYCYYYPLNDPLVLLLCICIFFPNKYLCTCYYFYRKCLVNSIIFMGKQIEAVSLIMVFRDIALHTKNLQLYQNFFKKNAFPNGTTYHHLVRYHLQIP